jgi:hypothetical protein
MIKEFRNWFADNWMVVLFLLLVGVGIAGVTGVTNRIDSVKQACFREGMIAIQENGAYYCVRIDQLVAVDIK